MVYLSNTDEPPRYAMTMGAAMENARARLGKDERDFALSWPALTIMRFLEQNRVSSATSFDIYEGVDLTLPVIERTLGFLVARGLVEEMNYVPPTDGR